MRSDLISDTLAERRGARSLRAGAVMKDDELENRVFSLVGAAAAQKVPTTGLTRELSLRRDLGLDSLGLVTLFMRFADDLGVESDDLIELMVDVPVHTIADMVELGQQALGRKREGG